MGCAGDDDDCDDDAVVVDESVDLRRDGIGGAAREYLGAVQLLQMPVVIYGGALADVMNRKVLMAMTQSVSFLSLLTVTVVGLWGDSGAVAYLGGDWCYGNGEHVGEFGASGDVAEVCAADAFD